MLAVAAMGVVLLLPEPAAMAAPQGAVVLSAQGKAALAVLCMAVILWMTEAIPFPVTGLVAVVLLTVTRAAEFKTLVRDGFGNPIILFFIGVLIFSAAISETNLLRRVTTLVLFRFGHSPKAILFGFLVVGAMLSAWITDMAVAAMLLPIGVSVLRDARLAPRQSNFGRALMISCAWGPLIGGVATPAGCGPNPLTVGFLKDLAGVDLSFAGWMAVGFPATFLMLPCAWLILLRVFPIEEVDLVLSPEDYQRRRADMGGLCRKEALTLGIFLLTVTLWVCTPWIATWTHGAVSYLNISFVAIACACLFFLPGVDIISWERAEKSIGWGGIILVVSGLSLGMAIYKTGAAEWMAWVAFRRLGELPPYLIIFCVVLGVSLMKVMFSSNTVTGVIVVPLLIALAKAIDLDPVLIAVPAGITASLAFILVTSTPTNVIPYSSGYFSIRDMAKAGAWMTIASSVCVTVSLCVFGRLFGIVTW